MKNLTCFNRVHKQNSPFSTLNWNYRDFLSEAVKTIDRQNETRKNDLKPFSKIGGLLIKCFLFMQLNFFAIKDSEGSFFSREYYDYETGETEFVFSDQNEARLFLDQNEALNMKKRLEIELEEDFTIVIVDLK